MQHHNLLFSPEWCGNLLLFSVFLEKENRDANPAVHHTGTNRARDRKSNIQSLSSSTTTSHRLALFSGGLWPKSGLADQTEIPHCALWWQTERARDRIQSVRRPADYTHHSLVSRAICRRAEQVSEKVRLENSPVRAVGMWEDKYCLGGQILEGNNYILKLLVTVESPGILC